MKRRLVILEPTSPGRQPQYQLTVFTENTQITLSQGAPSCGLSPVCLAMAFARFSVRVCASVVLKVLPVKPQVKGFLLAAVGYLPYFSSLIKSAIGIESGGSGLD